MADNKRWKEVNAKLDTIVNKVSLPEVRSWEAHTFTAEDFIDIKGVGKTVADEIVLVINQKNEEAKNASQWHALSHPVNCD